MRVVFLALLVCGFFLFPYFDEIDGKKSQETLKTRDAKSVAPEDKLDLKLVKSLMLMFRDILFEKFDDQKFEETLIHFVKAFGDREILETFYSLDENERDCIIKAKESLRLKVLSGAMCPSSDEALGIIQKACPNSKDQIKKMFDRKLARIQEVLGKIKEHVGKLPKSIQLVCEKLLKALQNLKKNCNFINRQKVYSELLPVLEQRLKVPDEDLKKFAELCPDLEPVLTGELKPYVDRHLRNMIQFFKTGEMDAYQKIEKVRFIVKMTPFWREKIQKLCDTIMDTEVQDLPDNVVNGIEEDVPKCVDKLEKFLKEDDMVEKGNRMKRAAHISL